MNRSSLDPTDLNPARSHWLRFGKRKIGPRPDRIGFVSGTQDRTPARSHWLRFGKRKIGPGPIALASFREIARRALIIGFVSVNARCHSHERPGNAPSRLRRRDPRGGGPPGVRPGRPCQRRPQVRRLSGQRLHGDRQGDPAQPRDVALEVARVVELAPMAGTPEVAGPGFLNVRLAEDWIAGQLAERLVDEKLGLNSRRTPRPSSSIIRRPTSPSRCTSATSGRPSSARAWRGSTRRSAIRSFATITWATGARSSA